jgi:hypothetical protein
VAVVLDGEGGEIRRAALARGHGDSDGGTNRIGENMDIKLINNVKRLSVV